MDFVCCRRSWFCSLGNFVYSFFYDVGIFGIFGILVVILVYVILVGIFMGILLFYCGMYFLII